jgi:hypothetical protein
LELRELPLGVFVYMPQESCGDHEQYSARLLGQVSYKDPQLVPTRGFEATTKAEHRRVLPRTPLQMQLHSSPMIVDCAQSLLGDLLCLKK